MTIKKMPPPTEEQQRLLDKCQSLAIEWLRLRKEKKYSEADEVRESLLNDYCVDIWSIRSEKEDGTSVITHGWRPHLPYTYRLDLNESERLPRELGLLHTFVVGTEVVERKVK